MLKIKSRNAEGVTILDLNGRIVRGQETGILHEAVQQELHNEQRKILLDLGEVSEMDSSGLGEILGAYASAARQGGELKLCCRQTGLMKVLDVIRLNASIPVFASQAEALKSFAARAAA